MSEADTSEDYLALDSYELFSGSDPRGIHSAIRKVTANGHRMLNNSNAPFSGAVHGITVGRIGLVSVRYSRPLTVNSYPTRRRILIVIPRAPMNVSSLDRQWFSDAPFAMGTDHHTQVVPSPGRGALLAAMDAEDLEYAVEVATGRRFIRPLTLSSQHRPLLLAGSSMIRSAYGEACRGIETSDGSVRPELLEHHLFSALAIGLSPFLDECLAPTSSPGRGYLETATQFISTHLPEDLSVSRIARCCGISERQLHTAFKDYLQISPAQYVREKRLQAARRLLTDPDFAATGTVSGAAARVGVTHFGRFAKAYAERYDEPPSRTLAQTRCRPVDRPRWA